MNLKTVEFNRTEKETKLELPVYLYFQDEMCNDELQKIEEDKITILKYTNSGFEISVSKSDGCIDSHYLKNITTKEYYDDTFKELIGRFNLQDK